MQDKRTYHREYYHKHREKLKAKNSARQRTERGRAYFREYYHKNKERRLAQQREYAENLRITILQHYGNGALECVRCGYDDHRALSVDHIKGNGRQHRQEVGQGRNLYLWIKRNNFPPLFQTLCMNCQFIKRGEEEECKH